MADYYDIVRLSKLKPLATALVKAGWELSKKTLPTNLTDVYKKAHVKVHVNSGLSYVGTNFNTLAAREWVEATVLVRTSRGGYALVKDLRHKLHGAKADYVDHTKVADFMAYVEARAAETPPPIDRTKPRLPKPLPKAQDFVENLKITNNTLKTKSVCRGYKFIKVVSINEKGQMEDAFVPGVEPWIMIRVNTMGENGYEGNSVVIVNQKRWYQIQNYHYKSGNMYRIINPRIILTDHDLEMIAKLTEHCFA